MSLSPPGALALIGPGRAGSAFALALRERDWTVAAVAGRSPDRASTVAAARRLAARATTIAEAVEGVDLVLIAVPDAAITTAAAEIAAADGLAAGALVVHLAGSLGVSALAPIVDQRPDVRVGALHPLQTLPDADAGAARLPGAWCAVAGDDAVTTLAAQLGLQPFVVRDDDRAEYHAAACIAGNHLVALLGQVERIARDVDVPLAAFLPLVRAAVDNVAATSPAAALTGPVARGDTSTVARHLDAVPPEERDAYRAMAAAALRLTGRDDGELAELLDGRIGTR